MPKTDDFPELWRILGGRLRSLREALGRTLVSVSDETGIAPDQLSRLENGLIGCSLTRLLRLARLYGASLDVLLRDLPTKPTVMPPRPPAEANPSLSLTLPPLTEEEAVRLSRYADRLLRRRRSLP